MRIDEHEHPDYLKDRKVFYEISRGGYQAAEDAAIAAYIAACKSGKTEAEVHAAFFEAHNKYRHEDKL